MYVCICNGITDKQIRRAVDEGAHSLRDLQDRLGVAGCCGQCASEAQTFMPNPQGTPKAHAAVQGK